MKNLLFSKLRFNHVGVFGAVFILVFSRFQLNQPLTSVCAQSSSPCTTTNTPPSNGNPPWADGSTKSVYVDPTLPNQDQIRQAITDFASATGEPVAAMAAGSTQPAFNTSNTISFINNPSGSPNNFAFTQPVLNTVNGVSVSTNSSQTSFNTSSTYTNSAGQQAPAYDPSQTAAAAAYVYEVTLHELCHSFGLDDFPKGSQPPPGHVDHAGRARN